MDRKIYSQDEVDVIKRYARKYGAADRLNEVFDIISDMEKLYYAAQPASSLSLHPFRELKNKLHTQLRATEHND